MHLDAASNSLAQIQSHGQVRLEPPRLQLVSGTLSMDCRIEISKENYRDTHKLAWASVLEALAIERLDSTPSRTWSQAKWRAAFP